MSNYAGFECPNCNAYMYFDKRIDDLVEKVVCKSCKTVSSSKLLEWPEPWKHNYCPNLYINKVGQSILDSLWLRCSAGKI